MTHHFDAFIGTLKTMLGKERYLTTVMLFLARSAHLYMLTVSNWFWLCETKQGFSRKIACNQSSPGVTILALQFCNI